MVNRSLGRFAALSRGAVLICVLWAGTIAVVLAADPESSPPTARCVASGSVAHDALDKEGETAGAFGSGLAVDGPEATHYLAVADRGPGDGTVDYRPRYHALRVERATDDPTRLQVAIEATTVFTDADGKPFTGLEPDAKPSLAAHAPCREDGRTCLDPEAIVPAPDGTLYIADEYGPFIYQFDRAGHLKRVLHPTEGYLPRNAKGAFDFGNNDELSAGRTPNHGFEGLALSPDGHTLTALLQSPLVQDDGKRGGVTRLLAFDVASGQPVAEYAYVIEDAKEASERLGLKQGDHLKTKNLSTCELHAVDGRRFLAIERDNRGLNGSADPEPAADKSVWLIDLAGATNLLSLPGQPYSLSPGAGTANYVPLPEAIEGGKIKPVGKRLLIDLVQAYKDSGNPVFSTGVPEKWEGLALRPTGEAGHYTLLIATDNDFLTPVLHFKDRGDMPFKKAQRALDTFLMLFEVTIP